MKELICFTIRNLNVLICNCTDRPSLFIGIEHSDLLAPMTTTAVPKKPQKPTSTSVVLSQPRPQRISPTQVMLTWDLPENIRDRIFFIRVQYKQAKRSEDWETLDVQLPPFTTSHVVDRLLAGQSYRFRYGVVFKDNSHIMSPISKKFLLTPQALMLKPRTPPTLSQGIAVSPTSIQTRWTFTPRPDETVNGFIIEYRPAYLGNVETEFSRVIFYFHSSFLSFLELSFSFFIFKSRF